MKPMRPLIWQNKWALIGALQNNQNNNTEKNICQPKKSFYPKHLTYQKIDNII